MQCIWKYKLHMEGPNAIKLPQGAKILTVQVQEGEPHIWALVDPREVDRHRFIEIFGTGHTIPEIPDSRLDYVGTFQFKSGVFVFHVFERVNIE